MKNAPRTLSLFGAIAIGIGGMVGGGIFAVLGEAVSLAHGATALSFLVAGVVAALTAYAYAKLSVAYPNRGGTVVFIDQAFGHNLISGSVNFMLWLSYLVTISLYAVAFSSYGQTFFSIEKQGAFLTHFLISLAIILPLIINLASPALVGKSETLIVTIKLALLVLIIVSGAAYVDMERLAPQHWGTNMSIIAAGMIIFVAYEGFELIANSAEDIKDPVRNLPRAFYSSVLIVILLYILIAMITVGTVSEAKVLQTKDYVLAVAAEPALGQVGFNLVAVAAVLATFSAINATIYGNARLSLSIAKEGELPAFLEHENHHIPDMGIITTALFSLILANTIDLTQIAIIGSASFLLIFLLINISLYRLRREADASGFIALMAILASAIALATLLVYTYFDNPTAILVFIVFLLVSVLFELTYGRFIRGHFFQRRYKNTDATNLQ